MADKNGGSLSGLSEHEAKEFHSLFVTTFIVFLVVALASTQEKSDTVMGPWDDQSHPGLTVFLSRCSKPGPPLRGAGVR